VDAGQDPDIVSLLELVLPDQCSVVRGDGIDLAGALREAEDRAANPRRLTGLDRDRHTGFLTARVHPVNVTSPDVDLDPVGIGKRVAGDLAFGVGVGCAAPAIDGGSWPDSADLLDLEEAGLDDDLKLFEHGEE